MTTVGPTGAADAARERSGGTLFLGSTPTLHFVYFSIIEIATTAVITWYAATRWKGDGPAGPSR